MQQEDAFEIFKTAQAVKIGKGGGAIEYQLGRPRSGGDLHIRVTRNIDKGGYFGKGWVRAGNLAETMRDAVEEGDGCFSSKDLADGISSRCRNDPPFLAAILLAEGLTVRCEHMPNKFRPSDLSFRDWEATVVNHPAGNDGIADEREQPPITTEVDDDALADVASSMTDQAKTTRSRGRRKSREQPGAGQ